MRAAKQVDARLHAPAVTDVWFVPSRRTVSDCSEGEVNWSEVE